jgi:predicted phosphate transport protein (TIGR00153 family)
MSTQDRLLGWFEKRLKSKTLGITHKQISKAFDTVTELQGAVENASRGDKTGTERSIKRLFSRESEVDQLRRALFKELAEVNLADRDREDIMNIVQRLDHLADNVKDSARSVQLLEEVEVPEEIWDAFVKMSRELVECAGALRESIDLLDEDIPNAGKAAEQVEKIEDRLDQEYQNVRLLFIKYSRKVDPVTLMILKDLSEFIEEAADTCADTADYVKILAARGS